MQRPAVLALLVFFFVSVSAAATAPERCAAAGAPALRADCWLGSADGFSDRLELVAAALDGDPDAALVVLERIAEDGSKASPRDRAWHAELAARALQALGRSDEAGDAWERSLAIHDGTDRLEWLEPGAWTAALDVGDGRLVRAANGLVAAGRAERARSVAARAIALGEREVAVEAWKAAGGGAVPIPAATVFDAPPWRDMLPSLDLPMYGGKTFSFDAAKGHVLVVDFWASWCAPCVRELPFLDALYAEYQDDGLEVIAVNYQEPPDAAMAFSQTLGLQLPIAIATSEAAKYFQVKAMPTVVIVDRDGGVRARWEGYEDDIRRQMRDVVVELLAEEAAKAPPLGEVYEGAGRLEVEWVRAAREPILGVGLVDVAEDEPRIAAVLNRSIDLFHVSGHIGDRVVVPPGVGRVFSVDLGEDAEPLVVSYRPGGRQVLSFGPKGVDMMWFDAPGAVFGVSVVADMPDAPLLLATLAGVFAASRDGKIVRPIDKLGPASDVAWSAGGGWVLETAGQLRRLDGAARAAGKARPLEDAWNLLRLPDGEPGTGVTGFAVTSAAVGRFLSGGGRQAALALSSDQLVVVDLDDGDIVFRARIPEGVSGLAAGDLDGDGRDELILSSGKRFARLRCGDCDRRVATGTD